MSRTTCMYCGSDLNGHALRKGFPQCDPCWDIAKCLYIYNLWTLLKMWFYSRDWRIRLLNWLDPRRRGEDQE